MLLFILLKPKSKNIIEKWEYTQKGVNWCLNFIGKVFIQKVLGYLKPDLHPAPSPSKK